MERSATSSWVTTTSRSTSFPNRTSGRPSVVSRIASRGTFVIDGVTYHTPINNGPNTLHGGAIGIDRHVWTGDPADAGDDNSIAFSLVSPDGDQGFPGRLSMRVVYRFSDENELKIEFEATTDKPTPVNLCNHSYFNLAGPGSGTILNHVLTLNASRYTPVNEELIPTGEIRAVAGTPMDFTSPMPIGSRIKQVKGGYDHNYVLDSEGGKLALAATLEEPTTGRRMRILTTQPGVQFYTGNFLDGSLTGIGGRTTKTAPSASRRSTIPTRSTIRTSPRSFFGPARLIARPPFTPSTFAEPSALRRGIRLSPHSGSAGRSWQSPAASGRDERLRKPPAGSAAPSRRQ